MLFQNKVNVKLFLKSYTKSLKSGVYFTLTLYINLNYLNLSAWASSVSQW